MRKDFFLKFVIHNNKPTFLEKVSKTKLGEKKGYNKKKCPNQMTFHMLRHAGFKIAVRANMHRFAGCFRDAIITGDW